MKTTWEVVVRFPTRPADDVVSDPTTKAEAARMLKVWLWGHAGLTGHVRQCAAAVRPGKEKSGKVGKLR